MKDPHSFICSMAQKEEQMAAEIGMQRIKKGLHLLSEAKRDAKFKLGEHMRRASLYSTYINFLLETFIQEY